MLTESNTFDLKNAHLNIESPWLYWNIQAIICLQDCFNANFKNAEERIHEFLKVENNLDNLGFRICKLLFSLSSIIHNYKSNNWDKVSIDLSTCRKIFLNSDKQFSILFSNIFNSVFEKLGFSMSKDIFLNFVLGDSDLYIIPSIMLISNQNLNIVSLEKKKLLFDLIYTLSQCKGNFIDKESLVQKIWDQNYDPDQHDQTLYVNISRLKKIIENELSISDLVINQDSGYSLSKRLTTKIL